MIQPVVSSLVERDATRLREGIPTAQAEKVVLLSKPDTRIKKGDFLVRASDSSEFRILDVLKVKGSCGTKIIYSSRGSLIEPLKQIFLFGVGRIGNVFREEFSTTLEGIIVNFIVEPRQRNDIAPFGFSAFERLRVSAFFGKSASLDGYHQGSYACRSQVVS